MYIYTHQGKAFYAAQPAAEMSYLRILHASHDIPLVDIYANGNLIASSLAYRQLTNYLPVTSGNYAIQVFPEGQDINPVIDTCLTVPAKSTLTITAIGNMANIKLLTIPEKNISKIAMEMVGDAYIRFVHLSANAPAVDITFSDDMKIFDHVSFKDYTDYLGVNPGIYTLQIKSSENSQEVLTLPNTTLMPNMIYTVYVVGLAGDRPPLEAIITIDGK